MSSSLSYNPPVADILAQHAGAIRPLGDDRWQFELAGAPMRGTACLTEEWLLMEVEPASLSAGAGLSAGTLAGMLRANATLKGGVKFCLGGDSLSLKLSAEIPIGDQNDYLSERISRVFAGFEQGASAWVDRRFAEVNSHQQARNGCENVSSKGDSPIFADHSCAMVPAKIGTVPENEGRENTGENRLSEIRLLCKEAGWPHTERANGQFVMELDVCDAFCEALIERAGDDGLRLWSELDGAAFDSPVCRNALSVLLLTACHAVRWARVAAVGNNGSTSYRWEIDLGRAPTARELNRGLMSLSVACGISAREVHALRDRSVAERYLPLRGWYGLLSDPDSI